MHINTKFSNKCLLFAIVTVLSVIVFELFFVLFTNNFAIANSNETLVYSQNNDPDPYYGSKEYWNEHFGPHEDKYIDKDIPAGTTIGNASGGEVATYFIGDDITISSTNPSQPCLIIAGNVDLCFEDGHSLTLKVADSENGVGSAPDILLTKGNSLHIVGKGDLKIQGSSVNVDKSYVKGQDGTQGSWYTSYYDYVYLGDPGRGGNGSGGVGALIGTYGGAGGAGGYRTYPSDDRREIVNQGHYGSGTAVQPGGTGEASAVSGDLSISGNVALSLTRGTVRYTNSLNNEALNGVYGPRNRQYTGTTFGIWDCYNFIGSNGGGGQGGLGFAGAIFGSGGSGGAGGGCGGENGFDYTDYQNYCYPDGGGGGAGVGSASTYGGTAFPRKSDSDQFPDGAKDGENYIAGTSTVPGNGGRPSGGGGRYQNGYGVEGGKGGLAAVAGLAGNCFAIPGLLPKVDKVSSFISDRNGQESDRYLVYPQDECKIVLDGSLQDDEYIYSYSGQPIFPDYKVIHVPTGNIIDDDCFFEVKWENNDKPGMAKLIIKGNSSFSTTQATIGQSMFTASGVIEVQFRIANIFDVKNLSVASKVYNGEPISYHGEPYIVDEKQRPITDLTIDDVVFEYSKFNTELNIYEKINYVPKDVGDYSLIFSINKKGYEFYVSLTSIKFSITIADITINKDASEGLKIEKVFDGTIDAGNENLSGSLTFDNIAEADKNKLEIFPIISKFTSNDVHDEKIVCNLRIKCTDDKDLLKNYNLVDDTTEIQYRISQRTINVDSVSAKNRTYIADDFNVEVDDVKFSNLVEGVSFDRDSEWIIEDGIITDENVNPGRHNCSCKITNKYENYTFSDGQTITYNFTVNIYGEQVAHPVASGTEFYYNGKNQVYDVKAYPGLYTVEGNTGTEPGTYTAIYKLAEGKNWADVEESKKFEPYEITWEIKKHKPIVFENNFITQAVADKDQVEFEYKINDKPEDMSISNVYLDIEEGEEYIDGYRLSEDGTKLLYSLSSKAKPNSSIKFKISLQSDFYDDSIIEVKVNLVDKYNVSLTGIYFSDKYYDKLPISFEGNVCALVTDMYVVNKDISDKVKNDIIFEYYRLVDAEYTYIGDEAPKDCGSYKAIAKIKESNSFGAGMSSELKFEIKFNSEDIIVFNDVTESRCYAIEDLDYVGNLNIIDSIPEGENYQVVIKEIDDKQAFIDTISIDHDGEVHIKFNQGSLKPDKSISVIVSVLFDNYLSQPLTYTLNLEPKKTLSIGGITIYDKGEYDGDYVPWDGKFQIMDGDTDLTDELLEQKHVKLIYRDHDSDRTYDEPQVNAGIYDIEIRIVDWDQLYTGSAIYTASIGRRTINVKSEEPYVGDITKVYDATTSLPTGFTDSLEIDETKILDQDKGKVFAKFNASQFSSPDVYEDHVDCDTVLYGEASNNYKLNFEKVIAKYSITPKSLNVNEATAEAINRDYDADNYKVDIKVDIEGVIEGHEPRYSSIALLDDNNVRENIPIDSFTVELISDSESNELNSVSDNYCFNVEGEDRRSIEIKPAIPLYAEIQRKELPEIFLKSSVSHTSETGVFNYKFDHDMFPKGMLIDNTKFQKVGLVDDSNMIKNWNIDADSGLITYEIANTINNNAKAELQFSVESQNYGTSKAVLEICWDNGSTIASTNDNTNQIIIALSILFVMSLIVFGSLFITKRN